MTGWTPPKSFPDLSGAKMIALDVETRDPDLQKSGPGVRRGAYIVGVALGTDDGFRGYFPIAHDEGPNLNKGAVTSWLKRELGRANQAKIGTNILYDMDFLGTLGVSVKGLWYDVQTAEPLIDENAQGAYNLDALGIKYLGQGKNTAELDAECKSRGWKGASQQHIWRLPPKFTGAYAEDDVDLPLRIFKKQVPLLEKDELWDLFLMETRLLPLLLSMRQTGVPIDEKKLERTVGAFEKKLKSTERELAKCAGGTVQYWAAASIAQAFDGLSIPYPRTPKTKAASFTKPWLDSCEHPIGKLVAECRRLDKFIGTFLRGQIQDQIVNGRIHCLFNPLKSDEYGTVTGRFSSSHPNLQFIPVRDSEMGPLCRSMFVPESGCSWGKADYSQIEFRIFAHYAVGEGSEEFREEYRKNRNTDFHVWCAEMFGIPRIKAKTINFGLLYGMGLAKTAVQLELDPDEAKAMLDRYNRGLPFAKHTLQVAADRANARGWVRTIRNRRRRFVLWEPADWNLSRGFTPTKDPDVARAFVAKSIEESRASGHPMPSRGIRRASTHKALNAVIQGTAADLLKEAMVQCHEDGVFKTLTPHLTVHDELDVSVPKTGEGKRAWKRMIELMEGAIRFRVPVIVDADLSKNWGTKGE